MTSEFPRRLTPEAWATEVVFADAVGVHVGIPTRRVSVGDDPVPAYDNNWYCPNPECRFQVSWPVSRKRWVCEKCGWESLRA